MAFMKPGAQVIDTRRVLFACLAFLPCGDADCVTEVKGRHYLIALTPPLMIIGRIGGAHNRARWNLLSHQAVHDCWRVRQSVSKGKCRGDSPVSEPSTWQPTG